MKELTFLKGYQQEDKKRHAFDSLAIKTFDLSFEAWYQSGYWREKYIPYTLFDGEQAVANISVNIMDFNILGNEQRAIQIGTVMTDEAYRKQGLSRMLIEKVFEDWKADNHFVYLFANATVWTFYPKFGFRPVKQYQYYRTPIPAPSTHFIKLNMDEKVNREKLYDYAQNSIPLGKISMQGNSDLVMFYCITVYKDNVFYLPELDVIAIAEVNERQMHLLDVFSKKQADLDEVISAVCDETIEVVMLGFSPNDCSSYARFLVDEEAKDEMLFVETGKTIIFDENQLMFPLLSHA